MILRPYQTEIIEATRRELRRVRRVMIQSATGSGKTILTAHMLHKVGTKGIRSLFVVHRQELARQSAERFRECGVGSSFIMAGEPYNSRQSVQIAMAQTLVRRLKNFHPEHFGFIVFDEAHHMAADTWAKIAAHFPKAYHIGLSATPERLDGKGLSDYFDALVTGPSVRSLIDAGSLSPYRVFAPNPVDMAGVHIRAGDYAKDEVAAKMDKPTITGDAIGHYQRHCPGGQFITFCSSVEHSQHVADQFTAAGIPVAHVDGTTDTTTRRNAMRDFMDRKLRGLSNVDLFGEGVDVPDLHCAILLRPTQSRALHFQQVGRALRPSASKPHAIILDHAGNSLRLGLPDESVDWSLEGRPAGQRKATKTEVPVKQCPKCYAVVRPAVQRCECGHVFVAKPRELRHQEGELREVDPAELRRAKMREQGHARTVEALVDLAVRRGYNNPRAWAHFVANSRKAKGRM